MVEEARSGEDGTQHICVRGVQTGFHAGSCWRRFDGLVQAIWNNGAACMFSVSLMFAFAGLCVKLLNEHAVRFSVFQIVATRSGFAMIFTALSIKRLQHEDPDSAVSMLGDRSNAKKLVLRGMFGACAMCTYYLSIQLLTLGDAVTLFFSNAVVTAGASVLIGYEKPTWSMLFACFACAGGVLLISRPSFLFTVDASGADMLGGIITALASSCFATGAFLTIKSIGKDENSFTVALWFHAVSAAVCVVPMLVGFPFPPVWPTPHEAILLSWIVVSSFLGQLCLSRGFQLLDPSVAAAINLSQVAHARALSVLFLGDTLPWTGVLGSILIGGGVLSAQLGKGSMAKDDVVEVAGAEEDTVLLTDRQAGDDKGVSPRGPSSVLTASNSIDAQSEDREDVEVSLTDVQDDTCDT